MENQVTVKMQLEWHSADDKPVENRMLMVIVKAPNDVIWYSTVHSFDNGEYGDSRIVAWAYIEGVEGFLQKIKDTNMNKHFNADFINVLHDNATKAIQG